MRCKAWNVEYFQLTAWHRRSPSSGVQQASCSVHDCGCSMGARMTAHLHMLASRQPDSRNWFDIAARTCYCSAKDCKIHRSIAARLHPLLTQPVSVNTVELAPSPYAHAMRAIAKMPKVPNLPKKLRLKNQTMTCNVSNQPAISQRRFGFSDHLRLESELLLDLHFSCAMWPFRAVVLVNSAPHRGQYDFVA